MLTQDKNDKQIEWNKLDKQAKLDNDELLKLYVKFGSLTEKIASLEGTKKELENYRKEFAAYDYFMKATSSNGISYEIIKKKLPVINEEITTIPIHQFKSETYYV